MMPTVDDFSTLIRSSSGKLIDPRSREHGGVGRPQGPRDVYREPLPGRESPVGKDNLYILMKELERFLGSIGAMNRNRKRRSGELRDREGPDPKFMADEFSNRPSSSRMIGQ